MAGRSSRSKCDVSGSGAKSETPRNLYILQKLALLKPYVKSCNTRSNMEFADDDDGDEEEEEVSDNEVCSLNKKYIYFKC